MPRRLATAARASDPEARITALVAAHGAALLRIARRHSLCADDAHDAYQRALEIYLRRIDTVEVATEGAWMKVVVRHEAIAVRRSRTESVAGEEIDFDAHVAEDATTPEDRLASAERSARSAEVVRRLKPDEASALLLKAEGHSYGEIGKRYGWTYTKVNRAITEGRRRFLETYAQLEAGEGCEARRPALMALARGLATSDDLLELRPHLRHCPACRAVVRELRGGRRRVLGWLPLPAFLFGGRRSLDYATNIGELGAPPPTPRFRFHLQHLLHRLQGSDAANAAALTSSNGGGRGVSIAAALGICLSSVGAGTYCVATLVLPEPSPVHRRAERPVRTPRAAARPAPSPTPTPAIRLAASTPTATSTPARRSSRTRTPSTGRRTTSSTTATARRHEDAPPASPAVVGAQELGIERSAGTAAVSPAAAPATGGDEFSP